MDDETTRENRRIALDRAVQVGTYDGTTGNDETVARAEAYLAFLEG